MKRWLVLPFLLLSTNAVIAAPLHYTGEVTLWQDTVWSEEVLVDGILTVAPDVTLEIRPGTVVRFTPFDSNGDGIGEHELFVQGLLLALGSAAQPILFTSTKAEAGPGSWGALNLMADAAESRLEHCTVEYAYRGFHAHFSRALLRDAIFRHNTRGLQFQESQVTLERCQVVDNLNGLQFRDSEVHIKDSTVARNYWGLRGVVSHGSISGCRFEENLVNGVNLRDAQFTISGCRISGNRKGLYLQASVGEIRGNTIVGNSEHGILLEKSEVTLCDNHVAGNGRAGLKNIDARGELRNNTFLDNGEYAVVNDGANPLDARGNWWGTVDAARIARLVRDGSDRAGRGLVDTGTFLRVAPPVP